jgi:hypothetical protein
MIIQKCRRNNADIEFEEIGRRICQRLEVDCGMASCVVNKIHSSKDPQILVGEPISKGAGDTNGASILERTHLEDHTTEQGEFL